MNVASLELCKELYELSGWKNTHLHYQSHRHLVRNKQYDRWNLRHRQPNKPSKKPSVPAYDLEYLLDKLKHLDFEMYHHANETWRAFIGEGDYEQVADTPTEAVCKLAIELFKQGVLRP